MSRFPTIPASRPSNVQNETKEMVGASQLALMGRLPTADYRSEAELLAACRRREMGAFEQLYRAHGARLKSIAYHTAGNRQEADCSGTRHAINKGGAAAVYRKITNNSQRRITQGVLGDHRHVRADAAHRSIRGAGAHSAILALSAAAAAGAVIENTNHAETER